MFQVQAQSLMQRQARRSITTLGVLLLTLPLFSGCATIEGWFSKSSATIQAATTLAVGEAILSQKDPVAEATLANDIVSVTNKVEADISGGVTVAMLIGLAQAEVVKVGNPQEVLAGTTLLQVLEPILVQYVGTGLLSAQAIVDLKQFCGWVIAAATPYEEIT